MKGEDRNREGRADSFDGILKAIGWAFELLSNQQTREAIQ